MRGFSGFSALAALLLSGSTGSAAVPSAPEIKVTPPRGHGKRAQVQIAAARRPATIHHETRQLRRARERAAKKGR